MSSTVNLPKELIEKLQIKIKETDFKSVQDYVIYVLNQLVLQEKEKEISKDEEVAYTPEEEEEMKKRLKDMGYI